MTIDASTHVSYIVSITYSLPEPTVAPETPGALQSGINKRHAHLDLRRCFGSGRCLLCFSTLTLTHRSQISGPGDSNTESIEIIWKLF